MADPNIEWLDFLSSKAPFSDDVNADQGMIAALTHLGVLAASGPDAENFLHNQLTNDVLALEPGALHLAGYCSAKGRLLATLIVWKSNESIMLLMPREILPGVQKRLQMFVLRSKVTLSDVSDQTVLIGAAAPDQQNIPWPDTAGRHASWTPSTGLQRALWMGPAEQAIKLWDALSANLPPADASRWRWLDIRAGLPMIVEATREQFVPQMVNFDLVGGVNFRKGCYPGQEIVARSQYLGKLKRRMRLASAHAALVAAGMEIFSDADPGQPCGLVVNAERNPEGFWDLLVEIKLDAAETPVRLGATDAADATNAADTADKHLLRFSELPYALRDSE